MKIGLKIILEVLIILIFNVPDLLLQRSEKSVHEKLWQEYCYRGALALNDCNWCHCDSKMQYICTAQICSTVDMFGHFKDTIKEVDVGMEGHGVWRTAETACMPGMHYRKGELLCVCTEEGLWPSPVCRDVFQVLYSVEKTDFEIPNNQECSPTKLYQISCNTCYCPENGTITATLCTKKNCSTDIAPITKIGNFKNNIEKNDMLAEIYAACERAKKYQLGCQTCVCLPSNRLLCDNCTTVSNFTMKVQVTDTKIKNFCSGKVPGRRFKKDCNICFCDKKENIYCTVLKCLESENDITVPSIEYESVEAPIDDYECIPATTYNRDCNTCHCFMLDGAKYFGCTVKKCVESGNNTKAKDSCDCVEGTKYEKRCLICQCVKVKGAKTELCTFNEKCRHIEKNEVSETKLTEPRSLDALRGYCEPLHIYYTDCNKCRCLTDGNTISCTSKICKNTTNPDLKNMVVEFIPFIQKQNVCPKGHKYMVDCNLCHCMSNGNALCTTKLCKPNFKTLDD